MGTCSECGISDGEGRKLKAMFCGHAYCSFCMFLVTKDQQGHMPCSSCREDTLKTMVADTRYQQLSGAICIRHGHPVTLYCLTCGTVVCHICTMLEHRSTHGHILVDKKEESENRFKDLFAALEQVKDAQKHLSKTSSSVAGALKRHMDITQREIGDISKYILDKEHDDFRKYLDSELLKLGDIVKIIADMQKKTSTALVDFSNASTNLKAAIETKKPTMKSDVDYTKYIVKPFSVLGCGAIGAGDRLSVVLAKPPEHFTSWRGNAIGVLWALPKQLLLVADERFDGGDYICIYSFNPNNLTTVEWTYNIKPDHCSARSVLCQDVYRYLQESWIWIAVGNEIIQLSLDLQTNGCPIKGARIYHLKLPNNAFGMTAIACKFGESYVENTFLVTTESTTTSMLSVYDYNGVHQEDIALGRLSRSITDITIRPELRSLIVCDAEAAIVRSYDQETFSSRDQFTFTLPMTNNGGDSAIPISTACNKMGDLLILWMLPELRKGDIVYSLWNITAHQQDLSGETDRIFVIASGNSLETGIPVGVGCWDYDVAVSFQDGRIRILKNFPTLNVGTSDWAGQPEAILQKTGKRSRAMRPSEELRRNKSLLLIKSHHTAVNKSKLRRTDTVEFE